MLLQILELVLVNQAKVDLATLADVVPNTPTMVLPLLFRTPDQVVGVVTDLVSTFRHRLGQKVL
jgi:hypothetical protein